DGDEDNGDSSGDDADDKNEDEDEKDEDKEDEEEEEEEHLAPADSAVVVPTVELASISLPPEAEVERLLAMPTPPPSPLISLSPPSTLRIASTQALIDAVIAALPSPPLPPLPTSLYIPPPIDRMDDIPESERPPCKRLCLSTMSSRYEVRENSTARPTGGQGIDYGFVSTVDVEERRRGIREVGYGIRDIWVDPAEADPEIVPMTVGGVNTRVTKLAELHEHVTQNLYALLEDAQEGRTRISQRVTIESQRVDLLMEEAYASREAWAYAIGLNGSHSSHRDNRRNVQTARPCFYADFMKCQPLNFKGTEGVVGLTRWIEKMESIFNISGCAIKNQVKFATCTLLGAALTWWNGQIRTLGPDAYTMTWEVLKKKMTDKYCPQGEIKKLEIELWNLKVKGNDVPTYTKRFQELTLISTKFVANETEKVDKYNSGLPDNIYGNVKSTRPKTLDETIELANDLMDQKLRTYAERQSDNKRKADDSSRNNHGHQ
ncbi:reverse transcriptase domain-containing protein, partial [Tanacetum coccineum]